MIFRFRRLQRPQGIVYCPTAGGVVSPVLRARRIGSSSRIQMDAVREMDFLQTYLLIVGFNFLDKRIQRAQVSIRDVNDFSQMGTKAILVA